ncbi:MAG: CocE/NonD family hydrolase [Actinobacteria bacterium]|nr:CocE/NonD family hydrolase [Actinomycetota bacterium]
MEIDFDVPALMRDGTTLRANVYRPSGTGPFPTLLTRTPYGKESLEVATMLDPIKAAREGFMVIVQDTRGRFSSDGEWEPFRFEGVDGFDSVEWAAGLPLSNGKVGLFGESYLGSTQWSAAIEQPPSLKAIAPALTWADPMDGLFARGGAVELGLTIPWTLETGLDSLARSEASAEDTDRLIGAVLDDYDGLAAEGYWELPVATNSILERYRFQELGAIKALGEPGVADWCRVAGRYDRVEVPSLHIAGWYDVFLQGTIDNFLGMVGTGQESRLVVGPWTHGRFADPIGEIAFGARGARYEAPNNRCGDTTDLQLDWFRRHLTEPKETLSLPDTQVRLFVMGRNEWRDLSAWPDTGSQGERWFLHHGGGITTSPPESAEPHSEYVYDPGDPTPTLGGQILLVPAIPGGPVDQGSIEGREDVCVFTTAPLERDIEVTGRVRVVLHAVSSATSTDWVVRLCEVWPDGRAFNVCDGILRVSSGADSLRRREIDLWSTSKVFKAGRRIRVDIASSSFPRWDRNLNTGDQGSSMFVSARQRICHDVDHPSYIELPVTS